MSSDSKDDQEEAGQMSEGFTHTGPEAVTISGAAIGRQDGPPAPERDTGDRPESRGAGNSGVQNLGLGQINMSGCVTGDGAFLIIGGASGRGPTSGPEPEAE